VSEVSSESNSRIGQAILDFLSKVPSTTEAAHATPRDRARSIASAAALRAAVASGTLALPPGPAGLVTILPDLVSVWRIQAKMVADIAGAFDKAGAISREQMLYCMFRHSAAQAVRGLVVQIGERYLVRPAGRRVLDSAVAMIGSRLARRVIAKSAGRWLPVIGALGVAGYAYYDTAQVAATATSFFERDATADL